jgi:hypothetical protein
MVNDYPAIPVIMYHSVGIVNKNWLWNHLTCPWKLFESHLRWLKRIKINTISLQDLYDYKKNGKKIPSRSIVLTFDDGYLDNWVFVYPLLKKYGLKGTIFISPEFVDRRNVVRKTLEDIWNKKCILDDLEVWGFLSWEEIKMMEEEGVMDIQSHSMSHTWYFCSSEIIDFHHPGNNKYPWLFWNARPERKSYYLNEDQERFVPYGTPIYKNGRSLGVRRYYEDQRLNWFLENFVSKQKGNFFHENNWINKLYQQVECYKSENTLNGRYESEHEQEERFRYELVESKKILEEKLQKKVSFLCWPGGAKSDSNIKLCFDTGYKAYTIFAGKSNGKNTYSEDAAIIYRIGAPNVLHKKKMFYLGGFSLIIWFYEFRGNFMAKIVKKVIRLLGILILKINLGIRKDILVVR